MSEHASRVIILSNDAHVLELCHQVLDHDDFAVQFVDTIEQALDKLWHHLFDLVVLDWPVSSPHGLTSFTDIRGREPNIPIVLLMDTSDLEHVAQATRLGAQAVLLKPFSVADLRNTMTSVLQRRRALRTQNRVAALRPLVQISQRLLAELDLPRLYDLIIETVRVELKADRASLMLLEEDATALRIVACSGLSSEVQVGQRIELEGSLAGWVAHQGQPLIVNSQHCSVPELQRVLVNDCLSSALSVPLMSSGQVWGVLNAAKTLSGLSFTEADQELLVLLAGQATIAIKNARLYHLAQRRADRLALLYQLSTAVTGSLDLEQIIGATMRHISEAFHIDHGYIFLSAGDPQRLVQYISLHYAVVSPLTPLDVVVTHGIIGRVLSDGHPRVEPATEWNAPQPGQTLPPGVPLWEQIIPIAETQSHTPYIPNPDLHPISYGFVPVPNWLCVALMSDRGSICGAIELLGRPGQQFGEDDIHLMTAMATPVAMAIETARLHASVAHSEARYRALLQHATEAVLLLDSDGQRILDVNPAVEQLSGYTYAALLQIDPNSLLPGVKEAGIKVWIDDHTDNGSTPAVIPYVVSAPYSTPLSTYYALPSTVPSRTVTEAREIESLLVAKDGRSIPVAISVSRVPYDGQKLLLVMVRDISERQRIAQQLLQTEKLAAVGRLSASIAHEINNPLQAIHNSLHLLNNRPLSEEKRQLYLTMAQEEVDRLITIVQRMLDFYRPARDGVGMRPTDLHELLESVLALINKQLQTCQIHVVRDWAAGLPRVLAIGNHLKQVYLNLILNAIESMPEGGVLTIRTTTVEHLDDTGYHSLGMVSTTGSAGHRVSGPSVIVEISDTGQGISPDILPKIFEPFYTTRSTGTGLGLAISYSIVEQHQGELAVSSVLGQGTTFRLRLPALPPE